jgi:hypothetical protein
VGQSGECDGWRGSVSIGIRNRRLSTVNHSRRASEWANSVFISRLEYIVIQICPSGGVVCFFYFSLGG